MFCENDCKPEMIISERTNNADGGITLAEVVNQRNMRWSKETNTQTGGKRIAFSFCVSGENDLADYLSNCVVENRTEVNRNGSEVNNLFIWMRFLFKTLALTMHQCFAHEIISARA